MRIYSKLIRILSPIYYFFAYPALVFAADVSADPCPQTDPFKGLCDITGKNFGKSVGNLITAAIVLAALVALGFLIYGGVKWIMSEGDKTAVETARQTVIGAVVGLVIVLLSYFILSIVLGVFGISLTQLKIPSVTQ